jgi:hypothetical protein
MANTYKGKSLKPGGGGRFAKLVDRLRQRGMSEKRARAVAASVGRRKYGAKQMAAWSAQGRKRSRKG